MKNEKEFPGAMLNPLDGYLSGDPEQSKDAQGNPVSGKWRFSIPLNGAAVPDKLTSDGKPYRPTWWITCHTDTPQMSKVSQELNKGDFVRLTGQLTHREYEEKSYFDLKVTSIQMLKKYEDK